MDANHDWYIQLQQREPGKWELSVEVPQSDALLVSELLTSLLEELDMTWEFLYGDEHPDSLCENSEWEEEQRQNFFDGKWGTWPDE